MTQTTRQEAIAALAIPSKPRAEPQRPAGNQAAPAGVAAAPLRKWLEENKRDRTLNRQLIQLLADADMERTWQDLLPRCREYGALWVASVAYRAVKDSSQEIERPPSKAERHGIERVAAAARKLRQAINQSSLPGNRTRVLSVEYMPGSVADLEIGWREVRAGGMAGTMAPVIVLADLAEDIAAMAEEHLQKAVPRAAAPDAAPTTVFVRWLHFHLLGIYEGVRIPRAVLADLTNAILKPSESLSHREVTAILRDSPPEFLSTRLRRK